MIGNYDVLEDAVRDSYSGIVWSHKIQEKQADIYAQKFKHMEIANIGAASLTSAGIIAIIFTDPLWLKIISTIVSFISVYITAYYKSFDLQKLAISHKTTANKLIAVRNKYKVLLTEIRLQSDSVENLLTKHYELVRETNSIYSEAPITTDKAVKKASEALKLNKDNTFTNEEIDSFLPQSLRKESKK